MSIEREIGKLEQAKKLGEIELGEDATENVFLLASIAVLDTEELPQGVNKGQVIEAAFKHQVHSVISTEPALARRKIVTALTWASKNGYTELDYEEKTTRLTDKGREYCQQNGYSPSVPAEV